MKSKYYLKFTGKYLVRMVTLLLAVSVVSFVLVSLSPVSYTHLDVYKRQPLKPFQVCF